MRAIFSIVGLVIVMALVGFLAKSQLSGSPLPAPTLNPGVGPATSQGVSPQQVQQQFKQSVETALQPARVLPDDK